MPTLVSDLAMFLLLIGGGGLWVASWLHVKRPTEAFCVGLGFAMLGLFFAGFLVHVASLPRLIWFALPGLAAIGLWTRRRQLGSIFKDPELRAVAGAWAIFAAWSIGLLGLVVVYSGGSWCSDWLEHYDRAVVFLHGSASDQLFYKGYYTLSARPPLINVVTAVLMRLGGRDFADCQVLMTLLGTLIIFPAWLLTARWIPKCPANTPYLLGLLLMINPMVMQNLTFNWTKSHTAFWVLGGVYFLLRGLLDADDRRSRMLAFAALAAGMLTHYSAGPWVVICVGAYVLLSRSRWFTAGFWRETANHGVIAALIFTPWLGWLSLQKGVVGAITENSTAMAASGVPFSHLMKVTWLNVRDTLIPIGFRDVNTDILIQASALGRLRDDFFNLYQISLLPALGFGGLMAIVLLLITRDSPIRQNPRGALGWSAALVCIVLLGIAVHTPRDDWGLAHICLQPLILLGLTWLASRLADASRVIRIVWVVGATADLFLGIFLHYGMQALWLEPLHRLSPYAFILNYRDQIDNDIVTFGGHIKSSQPYILFLLAALLAISLLKAFLPSHERITRH